MLDGLLISPIGKFDQLFEVIDTVLKVLVVGLELVVGLSNVNDLFDKLLFDGFGRACSSGIGGGFLYDTISRWEWLVGDDGWHLLLRSGKQLWDCVFNIIRKSFTKDKN